MIFRVNVVLNRTVVDSDYIHSDDHATYLQNTFCSLLFFNQASKHHDKSNSFQDKDEGVLYSRGREGAYIWVNVLFSCKWAYNWGVFVKGGGGVNMAI